MSDKKNSKIIDVNEWIDSYSTFMADEALKLIKAQGAKKGPEVFRALTIHFMARVMTSVIFEVLHDRTGVENGSKKEIFEHNKKMFSQFKEEIQEMVAMSFSTAMSHYGGKDIDYYCQIKPVPNPVSGSVN